MDVGTRVYRLYGARDLRLERESLDLRRTARKHVGAKTLYSAVSIGTELAAFRGDPPLRPTPNPYPRLMGYCNVAEVLSVGRDVTSISVGDRIVTGQSHREAFAIDEDAILAVVPKGLESVEASMVYMLHLGYQSLLSTGVTRNTTLGIIGLGPIGLGAVACSKMLGAGTITISEQGFSREVAEGWGARATGRNHVGDISGLDVVILTSNAWEDWEIAMEVASTGATIGVVGFPGRNKPIPGFNPLDSKWLYDKQLSIKAVGPAPSRDSLKQNISLLLNQMALGQIDVASLIGEVVNWQSLGDLYQRFDTDRGNMVTAVLKW